MKRMTMVIAALIGSVLMMSAVAGAAKPDLSAKETARAQCKAAKKADKTAFKATYGSIGACIKEEQGESSDELKNASQECRAERDADADAFAETYGSNKNGKNAFGKCVSGRVKAAPEDDGTEEDGETSA